MNRAAADQAQAFTQVPFELRELWFALNRWEWTSLALVPASPGGSALWVARALAGVGGQYRGRPLRLIEIAADPDLDDTAQAVAEITGATGNTAWSSGPGGPRGVDDRAGQILLALPPLVSAPLAIPIAMAADAVVLCVELGQSDLRSASRTIDLVGRDKMVGSVIVRGK